MVTFAELLQRDGIAFDHEGNRIRYVNVVFVSHVRLC
jgi:hypothetical protein